MRLRFDNQSKRLWLTITGAATIVLLAAYMMVQQSTRLAANEQPTALAASVKRQLSLGAPPAQAVPSGASNAGLFVIVVDSSQTVLASSTLDGEEFVLPPPGTFAYASSHGNDTFTWQTPDGSRVATVIVPYKDKYIVAGQSLRLAEQRISVYGALMLLAWLGVVVWTGLALGWRP